MDHIRARPAGGQRLGPGHPIVFLHAGVCDRRMWHAVAPRYAAHGRAIAYDRRGYGLTRADPEDHAQVADLLAVLDALTDGEPAILVGASAGGRVALDMALLHPARARLVLVAPNIAGAPAPVYDPPVQAQMDELRQAEAAGDMERVNRCKARQLLDGVLAAEGRVTGETRTLFLDMNGIALRARPLADRRRSPRPPIRAWRTSPRRRWWPGATWIFRMCRNARAMRRGRSPAPKRANSSTPATCPAWRTRPALPRCSKTSSCAAPPWADAGQARYACPSPPASPSAPACASSSASRAQRSWSRHCPSIRR